MNIKNLSIIGLIMAFALFSKAQETMPITAPKVLPASPQAQLYTRYGEIPVNYSTGVPNITIPIYTLKAGQFELPLNISYHAAGNKVNDIASPVGLGWVLNAGGVIVQNIVNGIDSETNGFRFSSVNEMDSTFGREPYHPDERFLASANGSTYPTFGDISSDRYTFNFNGMSGVFRYNIVTGKLECLTHLGLKIERVDGIFKITDTEGINWIFSQKANLSSGGANSVQQTAIEYYLTEIKFPWSPSSITFNYNLSEPYRSYNRSESVINGTRRRNYEWEELYNPVFILHKQYVLHYEDYYLNQRSSLPSGYTEFKSPLLSSIKWKDLEIAFTYSNNRADQMKERLASIKISCSTEEKTVHFNNETYLGTNSQNYRMLLAGMEIGPEKYKFSYNTTSLPAYASPNPGAGFYEDFWGFYNGAHDQSIPFSWTTGALGINNASVRSYQSIREPNVLFGKAGIIESITYPTGGTTVFEFEQNRGENVYWEIPEKTSSINDFGGLRIKKISNIINGNVANSKYYEYEQGSTTTRITPDHFVRTRNVYLVPPVEDPSGLYDPKDITVYPNDFGSSAINGYPISDNNGIGFYQKVTEYNDAIEKKSGKREYIYSPVQIRNAEAILQNSDGGHTPDLIFTKDYAYRQNAYELVKESENIYQTIPGQGFLAGILVTEGNSFTEPYPILSSMYPIRGYLNALKAKGYDFNSNFEINEIRATKSISLLKQTVTKSFFGNGTVDEIRSYTYDPLYRSAQPKEIKMTTSEGLEQYEINKYAYDFSNDLVCDEMTTRNMISPILEKTLFKSGSVMEKVRTDYQISGNYIRPWKVFKAVGSGDYEQRITYNRYDDDGNILHWTKDGLINTSYIWSYNGKFPVAEIKNTTYSDIENVIGQGNLSTFRVQSPDRLAVDNFVLPLRNALPMSLITSYSYTPLSGLTSTTDPKAYRTEFKYDDFFRLKSINDHDGNIVSNYQYNYKPIESPATYLNAQKSGTFTKNDCQQGRVPDQVQYIVPAGKYSSVVSQAQADEAAELDIQTNGQAYANTNGACTISNPNPNNVFIVIENHCGQAINIVLKRDGATVGTPVGIANEGFTTFSLPKSTSATSLVIQVNSGGPVTSSQISRDDWEDAGMVVGNPNTVVFNNLNFSSAFSYTINLW